MVQPINLIFRYFQNRRLMQVWLYEQVNIRTEGCVIGFDDYVNLVLEDAEDHNFEKYLSKSLKMHRTFA
ncbi:Small nuclear ribonucleoprotein E [Sciurus carolinensis]|uniref:Small nuclear ribonucleoprotein E n=1 Tax=Sciurus carolinensis TaxID=30640 RepID=A0AA41N2C6_SCICA|nr:Small nuclear ribonucleoprotein E [Sciurus carolinensis]